jgi:putative nucleotidyltransferase with HDIG domain
MKSRRRLVRQLMQASPGLVLLGIFTILLGIINWLVVNQRVILYLFYIPVVIAAWMLSRRDSVAVAALATLLVIAYALFLPQQFDTINSQALLWAELVIWGGILMVTAYAIATLKNRMQQAMENLERAYRGVLAILSRFIETVDADTEAHCVRVSAWAVRIAEELDLDKSRVEEARIAGLLHDVGKVEISVQLLRKAGVLSLEEQAALRAHAERGAGLLKPLGGMLTDIADAIEAHHEKFDGTGYSGLSGDEIPLVARVIAVADAFDAMLSDRPYRKGISMHEALDTIAASSGSHFDPVVVSALQAAVNREGERCLEPSLVR